ncbi:MAG: hypothetical protein ACRCZP_18070, partial [Phycicoccus sp.]
MSGGVPVLDHPYVTVTEFRAHPTYLDTNQLRTGGSQAEQDTSLNNALLVASQWADDEIDMPLRAHVHVEHATVTPDRRGRIHHHPERAPVVQVTGLALGATPDSLDDVRDPQVWTEQSGRILIAYGPSAPGLAALQFGVPTVGGEVLARWTYVAGYPATQLAAPAAAAATSVTVLDPTGITAGTVLRLWTPGAEEAVTVLTAAGSVLTLSAPLRAAHDAGMSCTALPTTARQAVICKATAHLMRPAPGAQDYGLPGGAVG